MSIAISNALASNIGLTNEQVEENKSKTVFKVYRNTDVGNAKRLVAKYGKNIRFEGQAHNAWYTWNEKRWVLDKTNDICRFAKSTVDDIFKDIKRAQDLDTIGCLDDVLLEENLITNFTDDKEKKTARKEFIAELKKHALKSESRSSIESMISLAKSEYGISVETDDLDADHMILNTISGTIDLRTGTLRPHSREDMVTKMINTEYLGLDEPCPTWDKFIDDITEGDKELARFIQKAAGYGLTGSVIEHCLFILFGIGRNGKSTFLNTLNEILADYAQTASFKTFLSKKDESVNNDIARMKGARTVICSEGPSDAVLAEDLIKNLTGGEQITARFLYQEHFDFMPTHKIFMATNHMPTIRGTDEGIWSRIRAIPFNAYFSDDKIDHDLPNKLRKEYPGILAWMVRGCLMWQEDAKTGSKSGNKGTGLAVPKAVEKATKEYRERMDTFGTFITDCLEIGESNQVNSNNVYVVYKAWCAQNGFRPLNVKNFSIKLTEKGYEKKKTKSCNVWTGFKLKPVLDFDVSGLDLEF